MSYKQKPKSEPDAALTGAPFDEYDDWLGNQPDHRGYDAAFDRFYPYWKGEPAEALP